MSGVAQGSRVPLQSTCSNGAHARVARSSFGDRPRKTFSLLFPIIGFEFGFGFEIGFNFKPRVQKCSPNFRLSPYTAKSIESRAESESVEQPQNTLRFLVRSYALLDRRFAALFGSAIPVHKSVSAVQQHGGILVNTLKELQQCASPLSLCFADKAATVVLLFLPFSLLFWQ